MTAVLDRVVTQHTLADALHLLADLVAAGLAQRTTCGRVEVHCDQHMADTLVAAMEDEPEAYRNLVGEDVILGGWFNHAFRLRIVVSEPPPVAASLPAGVEGIAIGNPARAL